MTKIGDFNELTVNSVEEYGYHLTSGDDKVFLPGPLAPEPYQEGDQCRLFVYTDIRNNLLATGNTPRAIVDEIAPMKVIDVSSHGAFVDWGIEKDLLIPYAEQEEKLNINNIYLVRVLLDPRSNRLIGSAKIKDFLSSDVKELQEGMPVDLLIYRKSELGVEAVINQKYHGLLYYNEIFEPVAIGDQKKGFIHKIREDNKIDLRLTPSGKDAMALAQDKILHKLNENQGFLPYHDRSSPEEIKNALSLSKKIFKKAIGNLYKQKKIKLLDNGIQSI